MTCTLDSIQTPAKIVLSDFIKISGTQIVTVTVSAIKIGGLLCMLLLALGLQTTFIVPCILSTVFQEVLLMGKSTRCSFIVRMAIGFFNRTISWPNLF